MAIISSAGSGQASNLRQESAQKGRSNVNAAQALAKMKALEKKAKKYHLPMGELAIFTQQLASLLVAGLPLVQCLEALQDQTEDQCFPHRDPRCARGYLLRQLVLLGG
jgi:type IV pilus assembly protein PilC